MIFPILDFSDIFLKDNKNKHKAAKKIREKYLRMGRNRGKVKRLVQRAIPQLKKSKCLETDDTETVDYNNGIGITDVNDDVSLSSYAKIIIYEEPIVKHRNPKRKSDPLLRFYTKRFMKNVGDSYNVQFIKQVPGHLIDRLKRKTKNLKHPRDRIKERELKIARDNVSALMQGKFVSNPERFLNKTVLFDTSKFDKEKIIDRILENIPGDNDDIYLIREPGANSFSLRREDGT